VIGKTLIIYDKEQAIAWCLPQKFHQNRDEHYGAPCALGLDQPF